MKPRRVAFVLFLIGFALLLQGARQRISEDRDLKEIDLKSWDCLNRPEGSAKTPEQMERNRLKNRTAPEGRLPGVESTDIPGFLRRITEFEGQTKYRKRVEINMPQKDLLAPLEKKLVSVTGYLGLAYVGPPETTNCGSSDFHDWHLEVFEKPIDHPPQPGDTTPIICEISPRTQNAIYQDGIRIQQLTAFFRRADTTYEPTGHKAQKVRITGYLLWDDEHNGTADVGTTIESVSANKYHHPWRQAAWEIHPVLKIERAEGTGTFPAVSATAPSPETAAPTATSPAPADGGSSPPTPSPTPTPTPPPTPTQMVTIQIPLRIPTPQGEAVIPRGTRLPIVTRDAQTVTVQYMGQNVIIANGYTNSP